MKDFIIKNKSIIISVIIAIVVIIAGVIVGVSIHNKNIQKLRSNNQKQEIIKLGKEKILGNKSEEDKNKENEEKYTEQYKKYLELSDEEKEKREVIPQKYEVSYDVIDNIIKDQKEDKKDKNKIPEKFNLAEKINIKVENQGNYRTMLGFCSN